MPEARLGATGAGRQLARPRVAGGLDPAAALVILIIPLAAAAAGLRLFGEGLDYGHYLRFWESFETLRGARQSRFEPGFATAAWAAKRLGLDYPGFHALLAGFSLTVKWWFLRRWTRWPLLSFLAYLGLFYGLHEYTQIRQAVAIALGLLATSAFVRGRWVPAAMWLLAGALFQSSVLALGLGFGLYVALSRLWGFLALLAVAAAAFLVLPTLDPVQLFNALNPLALSYLDNVDLMAQQSLFNLQNVLMLLAVAMVAPRVLARGERIDRLALLLVVLGFLIYAVIIDVPVFSSRLLELFSVFLVVLAFRFPRATIESLAGVVVFASAAWAVRGALVAGIYG